MVTRFVMPKLGWTMEFGKVIKWLAKEGDPVKRGDEVLEIETDKVAIKVESPATGILRKILHGEGSKVPVDHVVAIIQDEGETIDDDALQELIASIQAEESSSTGITGAGSTAAGDVTARSARRGSRSGARPGRRAARGAGAGVSRGTKRDGPLLATPKARRLARENDVDLWLVPGSGPDGAVTAGDVEAYIESLEGQAMVPGAKRVQLPPLDPRLRVAKEEPVEGIRRVIADRMYSSLQSSAQLTITMEVNMDVAARFRDRVNRLHASSGLPRISYTDLIAFVISDLLQRFPKFNASFDGEVLSYIEDVNLGIAVATDRGLMVPVLFGADGLSLDQVAAGIKEIAGAARRNAIQPDQLSGSTFTITNLGMFGIDAFTPIINPPEIAILGVGRVATRPGYRGGSMVPEQVMVLSLSFDHQIIDGHEAAIFLGKIKKCLEDDSYLESLHRRRKRGSLIRALVAGAENGSADSGDKAIGTGMGEKNVMETGPGIGIGVEEHARLNVDVAIIGAGPAGNEAALVLSAMGLKTCIIEKSLLGGTCLNGGCVPLRNLHLLGDLRQKALQRIERGTGFGDDGCDLTVDYRGLVNHFQEITAAMREGMARRLADRGVEVIRGTARFLDQASLLVDVAGVQPALDNDGGKGAADDIENVPTNGSEKFNEGAPSKLKVAFKKAIIATGARFLPLAGKGNGVDDSIPADEVFSITEFPESVGIVGGGKLPLELASCFVALGVEDVTILNHTSSALDGFDEEFVEALVNELELLGVEIIEGVEVTRVEKKEDGSFEIHYQPAGDDGGNAQDGKGVESIEVGLAINCGTRTPDVDGLDIDRAGIERDENGRLRLQDGLATSNPNVFAIGDAANPSSFMFTYLAAAQGRAVVDQLLGMDGGEMLPVRRHDIPRGLFTHPPMASIGPTERECRERGIDHKKILFPFAMLVTSHLVHEQRGMIKILVTPGKKQILGAQVMGEGAPELVSLVALARKKKATLADLLEILYLHPTFSEIFKDAAFNHLHG